MSLLKEKEESFNKHFRSRPLCRNRETSNFHEEKKINSLWMYQGDESGENGTQKIFVLQRRNGKTNRYTKIDTSTCRSKRSMCRRDRYTGKIDLQKENCRIEACSRKQVKPQKYRLKREKQLCKRGA